jgi:hypothetical protein
MRCTDCDNQLLILEWTEYRNERHVHHVWRCCECDCCFETITDTEVMGDLTTKDDICPSLFPSLLIA